VAGRPGVSLRTESTRSGISLREQELIGLLALEYYLSREVALFGRYEHIAFDSSERGRNFNADEIRVGVRVRR
jgi:hypothetical protein